MDIISKERRSALMSRVKSKDTCIELEVRRGLHALGLRFRIGDNYRVDGSRLLGRPDIVLPKYRTVVFIHGCFWHMHNCHLFRMPKTRTDFWRAKTNANRERDARTETALRGIGWNVETLWECSLRNHPSEEKAHAIAGLASRIRAHFPSNT